MVLVSFKSVNRLGPGSLVRGKQGENVWKCVNRLGPGSVSELAVPVNSGLQGRRVEMKVCEQTGRYFKQHKVSLVQSECSCVQLHVCVCMCMCVCVCVCVCMFVCACPCVCMPLE